MKISFPLTSSSLVIATFHICPSLPRPPFFSRASYVVINFSGNTLAMTIITMSNQFYLAFKESEYPVLEVCQRLPLSVTFCRKMWKVGDVGLTTVWITVVESEAPLKISKHLP